MISDILKDQKVPFDPSIDSPSGATTPDQWGSGSHNNKEELQIPQSFRTGFSPSDVV